MAKGASTFTMKRHRQKPRKKGNSTVSTATVDSDTSRDLTSASNSLELHIIIKEIFNRLGATFVILVLLVAWTLTMSFTIPETVRKLNFIEWKHRAFITYLVLAAFGHFVLTMYTDTSLNTVQGSVQNCELNSKNALPFRAHLCRLCKSVILKRDHHCFLIGRCIGYHNQKYFVWFSINMAIGAFYCLFQTALYLRLAHDVEFPGAWTYIVLLPRALKGWFTGSTDAMELAVTVFVYICLIGGLVSLGFFVWEVGISAMGLTSYEALHGRKTMIEHRSTILGNLRDVFGQYWFIGMLLPMPLPQYGNGLYALQ